MSILPKFDKVVKERKSILQEIRDSKKAITKEKERYKENPRGCEFCPLNCKEFTKVIRIDKIKGRKIFIWAMSPFVRENEKGKELVGPSGELLWSNLAAIGIEREDCDIQNVVRCMTANEDNEGRLSPREPTKEEVYYCSKWTERALRKSKAIVHIVLGAFAAKTLLGREFKKGQTIFWSETLESHVICVYHPSYFLRPGYPRSKLLAFKTALKAAKELVSGKTGRFSFIKSQDYAAITDPDKARDWFNKIKEHCISSGRRVAIDIEDNKTSIIQLGACYEPGYARTVYMNHPELKISSRTREQITQEVKSFIEDPRIKKICHYGTHEDSVFSEIAGMNLRGFDYDTYYAEYLRWSNRHSYALAEIAQVRYPEFAGYKEILHPYIKSQEEGSVDYARIPMKILTPYNCADCHLTKLIERDTRKDISLALLKVYIAASFIIYKEMSSSGPLLDTIHLELVRSIVPKQVKKLKERLQLLAHDPDFNPGSPAQVSYVIYKRMKLKPTQFDKKTGEPLYDTSKETLRLMGIRGDEFPEDINLYRILSKMKGYLDSYEDSANKYNGELRTQWWLAGTETGRLRSTGGEFGINLQNTHGDPLMQNLMISDKRWREVL